MSKGDRVRYSAEGILHYLNISRYPKRSSKVINSSRRGTIKRIVPLTYSGLVVGAIVYVIWDGRVGPTQLGSEYIEKVPDCEAPTA